MANLEICEGNIKLVNIYGPNSDSPSFFEKIQEILVSNEQEYIIICGDFNIGLNPTLDTYNCIPGRKSGILRIQYGHAAAAEISFWTR